MQELNQFKENYNYKSFDCREHHLENLKIAQEKYPVQGILAWDLCRVLYVAGGAYLSGYIPYKEAMGYCIRACKIMQKKYSSWDEMMYSYLIGYSDWCENEPNKSRLKKYESLKIKENGIYSIPWNTKLYQEDIIKPRII